MREIRLSGSEGGAGQLNAPFLPLSIRAWAAVWWRSVTAGSRWLRPKVSSFASALTERRLCTIRAWAALWVRPSKRTANVTPRGRSSF